jgi:hypothetical protein
MASTPPSSNRQSAGVGEAIARPVGEAEEVALNELASFVFESGNLAKAASSTSGHRAAPPQDTKRPSKPIKPPGPPASPPCVDPPGSLQLTAGKPR